MDRRRETAETAVRQGNAHSSYQGSKVLIWRPNYDVDGFAAKMMRCRWSLATRSRKLSNVSRNLSIEVSPRHTDSSRGQITPIMTVPDALKKMIAWGMIDWGNRRRNNYLDSPFFAVGTTIAALRMAFT